MEPENKDQIRVNWRCATCGIAGFRFDNWDLYYPAIAVNAATDCARSHGKDGERHIYISIAVIEMREPLGPWNIELRHTR